jgi:sarcosine oxidase subunit alpha
VPPPYLAGRFGDKVQLWVVTAADARNFGPGCLVFTTSGEADPAKAIGVTYAPPRPGTHGGIAILSRAVEGEVFVRDAGTAVAARLIERLKPGNA